MNRLFDKILRASFFKYLINKIKILIWRGRRRLSRRAIKELKQGKKKWTKGIDKDYCIDLLTEGIKSINLNISIIRKKQKQK